MGQSISSLNPAGHIKPHAGATAPTGYLMCDGSSVSTTTYAQLFAAIGYAFGGSGSSFNLPDLRGLFPRGSDNMGTAAGAANRDPNASTRTASNTGGNTGNAVGSVQANATKPNGLIISMAGSNAASSISGTAASGVNLSHSHGVTDPGHNHSGHGTGVDNANGTNVAAVSYDAAQPAQSNLAMGGTTGISIQSTGAVGGALDHSHSVSGTASAQTWTQGTTIISGDAETRPINIYLNYIIKY